MTLFSITDLGSCDVEKIFSNNHLITATPIIQINMKVDQEWKGGEIVGSCLFYATYALHCKLYTGLL